MVACSGFLLLLELALALAGVKPVRFEKDPYVGFSSQLPLFIPDPAGRDSDRRVTAPNKRHLFNVQEFNARKPAGTTRIFCLGGSTTYGHPYDDATSFAGWLRVMLDRADPARRWEVINCGGISYASYREALLMEELIRYQPDLFIVLTGQNEFLEQRTYADLMAKPRALLGAGALLRRTRLHAAAQALVARWRPRPAASTSTAAQSPTPPAAPPASAGTGKAMLPAEVETMLEHVVGPQAYHRDPAWQRQVMDHFQFNLNRMVDIAATAGARVWFINPASNIRHCAPFKSEHRAGLTETELGRWTDLLQRARQAAAQNRWADSVALIDQAATLDDQFADLHFFRARVLWEQQRFPEARAAYLRARDEDVCPLRALSPMVEAVGRVGMMRGELIDFQALVEGRSEHAAPGEDWFLDHVHPTLEGNRQIALALLARMTSRGLARPQPSWNEAAEREVKRQVEAGLTPERHGTALCTLAKVLAWAGKHEEAYRVTLRAVQLAPQDAASQFEAGKNAAHLHRGSEARGYLQKALELRPGFVEAQAMLGSVLAAGGDNAEAIRLCREAIARRPEDPELHSNLGTLLERAGQPAEAVRSFREAIRLNPAYAEARNNLGWMLKDQGQLTASLEEFQAAHRLKPGLPSPAIGLAWLLATHPEAVRRDPAQAISLGERLAAQSEFRNWMSLDALAAGYAAAGRFDEAVRTAEKALSFARQSSPPDAAAVENRLRLYQSRQPFLESAAPPESPVPAPGPPR